MQDRTGGGGTEGKLGDVNALIFSHSLIITMHGRRVTY